MENKKSSYKLSSYIAAFNNNFNHKKEKLCKTEKKMAPSIKDSKTMNNIKYLKELQVVFIPDIDPHPEFFYPIHPDPPYQLARVASKSLSDIGGLDSSESIHDYASIMDPLEVHDIEERTLCFKLKRKTKK
ncbi:unnamed protein product, partial [Meganyctiphanes norvegica]